MPSGVLVNIIGGGFAGCECAFQLLKRGFSVDLYEMRPQKQTEVHKTGGLAEPVCSNSLKSEDIETASGLLKAELDELGCVILGLARETRVPAGSALAVDRLNFSAAVERELNKYDGFRRINAEIYALDDVPTVIATGPLTSSAMAEYLKNLTGNDGLYFYDAVAPIVDFESVDMRYAYFGGRYGKGGVDYLNLPMNREEYSVFLNELLGAETVILKDFDKRELFEGCMPVEEAARRGADALRFGPLRPVGLSHPETGEKAYAVVQLRKENVVGDCYNMVGFQTNLTFTEQKRVFSLIPALHSAEFLRYGVMHRNTYINSPGILTETFRIKRISGGCKNCGITGNYEKAKIDGDNLPVDLSDTSERRKPTIYIAGQLSGVEGYVESIASGFVSGVSLARELSGKPPIELPETTIIGALSKYVSSAPSRFQPMNANFGLLPPVTVNDKKARKAAYAERSLAALASVEI